MGLTNENLGPKILAKIKIYVLARAELLFKVCYEIPCTTSSWNFEQNLEKSLLALHCLLISLYVKLVSVF